jgi:putative Mg2+ transporter-C (MgtC) family protein
MGHESTEARIVLEADWLNLPDTTYMARVSARLVWAAVLGGLIGAERESRGKFAGLRTQMTVSLAAAAFVIVGVETDDGDGDLGRVIQGVAAGVGFLGAGTILKNWDEGVKGLTTASTIYLTAAIGVATGAGHAFMATVCVVIAWIILSVMGRLEKRLNPGDHGTGN